MTRLFLHEPLATISRNRMKAEPTPLFLVIDNYLRIGA